MKKNIYLINRVFITCRSFRKYAVYKIFFLGKEAQTGTCDKRNVILLFFF